MDGDGHNSINFAAVADVFPRMVSLLSHNHGDNYPFVQAIIAGISLSLFEKNPATLVQGASRALLGWLDALDARSGSALVAVFNALIGRMEQFSHDSRVITPAFNTFSYLMSRGEKVSNLISDEFANNFSKKLLALVVGNIKMCSDFGRVAAAIPVLLGLLTWFPFCKPFSVLLGMLAHPWPKIRSRVAQQLFEAVISNSSLVLDETKFEVILNLLTETNWEADGAGDNAIETLQSIFDTSDLLIFSIAKASTSDNAVGYDYRALVDEVGY